MSRIPAFGCGRSAPKRPRSETAEDWVIGWRCRASGARLLHVQRRRRSPYDAREAARRAGEARIAGLVEAVQSEQPKAAGLGEAAPRHAGCRQRRLDMAEGSGDVSGPEG